MLLRQGHSWTVCLATSGARRAGCGRRRRAILAHGGSRPFWAAAGGKPIDLRDIVRDYALETLADDDAVMVFDETGISRKQGKASCRRSRRQQAGSGGQDHELPDRRVLPVPLSRNAAMPLIDRWRSICRRRARTIWLRMKAAHVPEKTAFATKPALAVGMIERAISRGRAFRLGRRR